MAAFDANCSFMSSFCTATADINPDNTFRILLASDIHLGYCDNNPQRENDSFNTFEEILKIAREENVDFVLLGGDLFHENRPRPATLRRTIQLMRKHCLGSKAIEFEYWGDPKKDFPSDENAEINYLNPNMNIALPVFTIHGNHDDPVGEKKTSAVDHLVAAKLLNHFGQWESLTHVNIQAVALVKGQTKLALFGLGNIKDERLFRLFRDNNVKFARPVPVDDWFNVFVLHQNRTAHGRSNYIPESFIPHFMDLVVWGHEHECLIDPENSSNGDTKTYIIQPGSPVATSICTGEARDKYCGILEINKKRFRLEKRKLQTVRPMVMADIDLLKVLPTLKIPKDKEPGEIVEKYVDTQVGTMLKEADNKLSGHPDQPVEPLIRIRIFHENMNETFNPVRFAQKYAGRIANEDIVMFKKVLPGGKRPKDEMDMEDMDELLKNRGEEPDLDSHVESIVEDFFKNARENGDEANILEVLGEKGLSEAVKACVEKEDKEAFSVIIDRQIQKTVKYLVEREATSSDMIEELLVDYRSKRWQRPEQDEKEAQDLLRDRPVMKKSSGDDDDEDMDDDEPSVIENADSSEDDEDRPRASSSKRGRGKGEKAAPSRGQGRGRGRGRGRGKATDEDSFESPKKGRGRGGGKSAGRGSKSMIQTTLPVQVRQSPRKGATTKSGPPPTVYDLDDSD